MNFNIMLPLCCNNFFRFRHWMIEHASFCIRTGSFKLSYITNIVSEYYDINRQYSSITHEPLFHTPVHHPFSTTTQVSAIPKFHPLLVFHPLPMFHPPVTTHIPPTCNVPPIVYSPTSHHPFFISHPKSTHHPRSYTSNIPLTIHVPITTFLHPCPTKHLSSNHRPPVHHPWSIHHNFPPTS